jgi:hypothetical protein
MADPLESLARRATDESFFLASILAAYAHSEGLDDRGLAVALGCPEQELVMLRLCRAPRKDPAEFWDDVTAIAERFKLDAGRLAEIVKRGRVAATFQKAGDGSSGSLMAARDRDGKPPPEDLQEGP